MSAEASHVIAWFEIPSTDFDRAVHFYESALDVKLQRENIGAPMAVFNHEDPATGGCIVQSPSMEPSTKGAMVYLNARPTVDAVLERVKRAGGKVEGPAVKLPQEIGYIGFFTDTEGNRVGLHSKHNG